MSLHQYQTQANQNNYFFLLANVSTLTAQNVVAKNISTLNLNSGTATINTLSNNFTQSDYIEAYTISSQNLEANFAAISDATILTGFISSIVTNNIVLDGNTLDTGGQGAGASLLLNGYPIVTGALSSFSSLADWAFFPAASTLQMGMNAIANAGNIQCMNINSQNIYNALTVQTDTLSALTNLTSPAGVITNFRATNVSTINTVTSNLVVGSTATIPNLNVTTLTGGVGRFQSLSSLSISTGTLTAGSINGQPYAPASNWSQYAATSAVQMAGNNLVGGSNLQIQTSNLSLVASNALSNTCKDFSVVADEGINIASVANINLTAQNGTYGAVNITANGGFNNAINGVVNITANGSQVGGVGQGGSINLTANTPSGFSNLTSKISLNASGINSYAGVVPPLASAAGFQFIYGTGGVNICSGLPPFLPNAVGTTYIYGTTGVEIPSQAYMSGIEPYWNGLTTPNDLLISGRYIIPNLAQVCLRLSNVRQVYFQENVGTFMSNCDLIAMSSNGNITTSNLSATNGTIGTLSNTNLVGTGSISGYTTVGTTNLNTSQINSIPIANYLNTSTFTTASISSATISSINNFMSFGSKSARIQGDVAQLQLSNNNPAGAGTTLNLLSRTNWSEIQSYNSNFSTPLNLIVRGDNFGFNVGPTQISGGIEFDISGNTQVRWGSLKATNNPAAAGTLINADNINISSIRQPVIQYGKVPTTGNNGNVGITLSTAYVNANYIVTPIMNDITPAQMAVNINNNSNFTVYWASGGAGAHSIAFTTYGDLS